MKCNKKIKTPKDRSGFALIKPITKGSMWRGGPKPWWHQGMSLCLGLALGCPVLLIPAGRLGQRAGRVSQRTLSLQGPSPGWARGLEPPGTAGGSLVALDLQGPSNPNHSVIPPSFSPSWAWVKQRWSWAFVLKNLQKTPKRTKGKKKSFKIDF